MKFQERYILYSLALARRGYKKVFPNPAVGSLLVKDQKIISTGFHGENGKDHAEVIVLDKAGSKAAGATLYVSLEPCNHFGKTPPCAERIIESGVSKVIYGIADPNEQASGGALNLMAHGINALNAENSLCRDFTEPWAAFKEQGVKTVDLWAIISLNGLILDGTFDDDERLSKFRNRFKNFLSRNVQSFSEDASIGLSDSYHFAAPLSAYPSFEGLKYRIRLNLLRVPMLIPKSSDYWNELNFPNKLKLIKARKFGNAVLEQYSGHN